jgi:hypothetical protein
MTELKPISGNARQNRLLAGVTTAAAILLLATNAVFWLVPAIADPLLAKLAANSAVTITPATRIIVFLITTARTAILAAGLMAVATLFRGFARGDVFVPQTGRLLRRFGIALIAYTLLSSPVNTALIAAATWQNPPGERVFSIGFGFSTEGLLFLLTAGLVVALGHVMAEAARIADEHRQIV